MRQFGELEAVVMDVLWSREGSATVRDVLGEMQRTRSIAYTTVMTVMDNLHRKGFLSREMEGRAWRYEPVKTRERFTADLMVEVLEGAEDRTGTLMHFLDAISAPELRRLRRLLAAEDSESSP
ncbi:MAG: BlaI/MecI/CopY family transcriptional regulator [Nocardioidaceae bacterium]|nr:BlaI/MecI/CopY family transcriptional regulator [Nocardioidaceae bacterium]